MNHPILTAKGEHELLILPQMANRHGLVAGATGTDKTVTLQVLAENFSITVSADSGADRQIAARFALTHLGEIGSSGFTATIGSRNEIHAPSAVPPVAHRSRSWSVMSSSSPCVGVEAGLPVASREMSDTCVARHP